jgi:hypothetical protein
MNYNPYSPPQSTPVETVAPRDIPLLTNLVGLLCVLPGFGIILSLVVFPSELLETFSAAPAKALLGLALSVAAVTAGGALFALRPIAVVAFAVGLALALVSLTLLGFRQSPALFWCGILLVGLIYSSWLRSRGVLRSRPNNSSKPTPLRGAA